MEIEDDQQKVNLDKIPLCFPDLTGNKEDKYLLHGVVKYTNPNLQDKWEENKENRKSMMGCKKKIVDMGIGHYTAVCKRHNTWVEYNDAHGTSHYLKSKKDRTIFVGLLMYAKVSRS